MKPRLLDSTSARALRAASELTLEYVPLCALKPFPGNPRNHSKEQIRRIRRSIRRFKMMRAITVDESNRILAGHGVYAAAAGLGLKMVPVIRRPGVYSQNLVWPISS
jgi:ParB-like chromosome segregation protein Spo0J